MKDIETSEHPSEKITTESALQKFDALVSGRNGELFRRVADQRFGVDVFRNSIQEFAEAHPNNERLGQILHVLENPGSDTEAYAEKIDELIDLVE